ncbi:MAG: OmpH family outer membrane protein [Proteobacteria bacterium]|nr:OmpH family outer membrane protein [Pseudomonadota bacterium]
MFKAIRLALLSCLVVLPLFSTASADGPKIGYVNLERVFREAPAAIKASKKMQDEFETRRQEILRVEEDFKARQAALAEKRASLTDSQLRTKETELTELSVALQRRQQLFQEDLKIRQNEETSAFLEKANKAVVEIAKAERWDMILQEAVSVANSIDITDKVIRKMTGD